MCDRAGICLIVTMILAIVMHMHASNPQSAPNMCSIDIFSNNRHMHSDVGKPTSTMESTDAFNAELL